MFGGGTKYFAIWNVMKTMNENGQALREAFARGEDPISVELAEGPFNGGKAKAKGKEDQSLSFHFVKILSTQLSYFQAPAYH
jgi:hypothetical protein